MKKEQCHGIAVSAYVCRGVRYFLPCLQWGAWAVRNIIIYPFATMMLIVVLLPYLDNTTLGTSLVSYVESASRDATEGLYRVRLCERGDVSDKLPPTFPSVRAEPCPFITVDADTFAGMMDSDLKKVFMTLWILFSVIFSVASVAIGAFPYVRPSKINIGGERHG